MPSAKRSSKTEKMATPSVLTVWSEMAKLTPMAGSGSAFSGQLASVWGDMLAANQEVLRFAAHRVEHNLRTTAAIARCSDPTAAMSVWSEAMSTAAQDCVATAERVGSLVMRSAAKSTEASNDAEEAKGQAPAAVMVAAE